jgi:hypothetical protein
MTRFLTGFIICFVLFSQSFGQRTYETPFPKSYGLIFGYQGFHKDMIEIGAVKGLEGSILTIGTSKTTHQRINKPYAILYGSYHFDPIEKINGAILGFSGTGGVAFGIDFNYYNYHQDFWGFRPSIGISIFGVETLYRYNFRLSGEKVAGISGHQFTMRYYLPLWVDSDDGFKFGKKYRRD